MTVIHWVALVACAIVALTTWLWYSKSKNKGHLFMAICSTIAALAFFVIAIMD